MTDDRCEQELGELLEFGEPVRPPGAGARSRAVDAMQRSAAQALADSLLDRILGKGEKKMKRFAYAVAFLVLIGAAAAGLFSRSQPVDGRALLISGAEAMEQAQTIHVWGRANTSYPEGHPSGELAEGSYEDWYTPRGLRQNYYGEDGKLDSYKGYDIESGRTWFYGKWSEWFGGHDVFWVFDAEKEHLAHDVEMYRSYLVDGTLLLKSSTPGATSTTRSGVWNGSKVTVLEIHNVMPNGEPLNTTEAYLDAGGRLLCSRVYSPPECGRNLVAEMQVEYDVEPPADLFTMHRPPEVPVVQEFAEPYVGMKVQALNYFSSSYGPRYRISASSDWRARACSTQGLDRPRLAIDGDYGTRWTVRGRRHAQEAGMWFEVMFDAPVRANKLLVHNHRDVWAELSAPESAPVVDVSESEGGGMGGAGGGAGPAQVDESRVGTGWPVGAQVSITADGDTWEDVVTGQAATKRPLYANFGGVRDVLGIRITLTETSDEEPWSIAEIGLFGPPRGEN